MVGRRGSVRPRPAGHPPASRARRAVGRRFPLEALPHFGIFRKALGKDFDRDCAVQTRVGGFMNFPHSSGAQRFENSVRSELRSSFERHDLMGGIIQKPACWFRGDFDVCSGTGLA